MFVYVYISNTCSATPQIITKIYTLAFRSALHDVTTDSTRSLWCTVYKLLRCNKTFKLEV